MEKRFIEPKDLRSWWPYIRPKLKQILRKSPEVWIPEDIYADCFQGRSMLWVALKNNKPQGFVVCQPTDENTLHLWAGFSENDCADLGGWSIIDDIAKQGGASFITFDSWRKGWEKKAKALGFSPRKYIRRVI